MKSLLTLVLITFHAFAEPHFQRVSILGISTNLVTVPANTTAECVGMQFSAIVVGQVDYGNGFVPLQISPTSVYPSGTMLGPCNLKFFGSNSNGVGYVVLKLETVNTDPVATLVAPAGSSAVLAVETSTNLANWQTVTNAAFDKSAAHRFFRTRLVLP